MSLEVSYVDVEYCYRDVQDDSSDLSQIRGTIVRSLEHLARTMTAAL